MPSPEKTIILHPKACQDLEDAVEWSLGKHGKNRTKKYYNKVRKSLRELAKNKVQGKIRGKYFSDFFPSYRCSKHLIYYTLTQNALLVIAILHDAQNHTEHLGNIEKEFNKVDSGTYYKKVLQLQKELEKI